MKYKAIGFDWGGVIKGQPGAAFTKKVSDLLGIGRDKYRQVYFSHNKKSQRGDISWEQMWQLILGELGQPDKLSAILKISQAVNKGKINPEILALAQKLKASGYKTGILSNNSEQAAADMRELNKPKYFDVIHVSAETKLVKPEPEAFTHFANALDVKTSELVFIDDSPMSLSTAEDSGYTPVLFESYQKLVKDLKLAGVLK